MIQRVYAVYFSPCGNVEKIVRAMAQAAADRLGAAVGTVDLTAPAARAREYAFGPEDLAVVGTPVYAGRVPNKLAPDLARILRADGAAAAAVVSFGNRSFDDALSELAGLLGRSGFAVPAAAAVVSQHSFAPDLAPGRPDGADLQAVRDFARRAAEKLLAGDMTTPAIPGSDPPGPYYTPLGTDGQPARFLKAVPETDRARCTGCGRCVSVCPMGSIPPEDPAQTRGICIKCQACIQKCPEGARRFTDPAFLSHREMLRQTYRRPAASCFCM